MNLQTWKTISCLTIIAIAAGMPKLHAQTSLTLPATGTAGTGSTAVDFEFRLDGSIYETGSGNSLLTDADLQAGTVFLWDAPEGALRAGGGSTETASSVGQYSVAFG